MGHVFGLEQSSKDLSYHTGHSISEPTQAEVKLPSVD